VAWALADRQPFASLTGRPETVVATPGLLDPGGASQESPGSQMKIQQGYGDSLLNPKSTRINRFVAQSSLSPVIRLARPGTHRMIGCSGRFVLGVE
jgi:hypothetical protein